MLEVKNLKVHYPVQHGMFSGVRWYARRIDHFTTGPDDWMSGATAGELGERLAADYEAGALHQ